MNDALQARGDKCIIKPLTDPAKRSCHGAVAQLSSLLSYCERAMVLGFGTAKHWEVGCKCEKDTDFVTRQFVQQGIPVWDGKFHWRALAGFRA